MKWRLTGTASQQALAKSAIDQIKFPWDRLQINWMPEMGWRNLNAGYGADGEFPHGSIEGDDAKLLASPRAHGGVFHGKEGRPEPLNGEIEGRRFTYAVFYPGSARIYVDYRLERYPALALASVSAEVAHAADEFIPLTEAQRDDIIRLLGGVPGEMTWWEKVDYSTEYWSLAGEHFMPLFTDAYSEIPFGDTSAFQKDVSRINPDDLIRIIGIQRTDYVAPTPPPPPPPEPIIEPEAEIIPVPAPAPPAPVEPTPAPKAPHDHTYVTYGKSKIVHKPSHYPTKTTGKTITAAHIPEGFKACKKCKPH